jgi:hypothetical protein
MYDRMGGTQASAGQREAYIRIVYTRATKQHRPPRTDFLYIVPHSALPVPSQLNKGSILLVEYCVLPVMYVKLVLF